MEGQPSLSLPATGPARPGVRVTARPGPEGSEGAWVGALGVWVDVCGCGRVEVSGGVGVFGGVCVWGECTRGCVWWGERVDLCG